MRFFEFSIARKYLTPKKKQIAVSLIALMSVTVISLVVWLVLIFLSITEGMEKNWLQRLTSLSAPIRIHPTQKYFSSYYYLIDQFSNEGGYSTKTIGQKALSLNSDPYDSSVDSELPSMIPAPDLDSRSHLNDPVKKAFQILSELRQKEQLSQFQEYEMSGALLRLQLLRLDSNAFSDAAAESQNFLTQVSYLASFPSKSPTISQLLIPPTMEDINNLFYLSTRHLTGTTQDVPGLVHEDSHEIYEELQPLLKNIDIKEMKTRSPIWKLPKSLLSDSSTLDVFAHFHQGKPSYFSLKNEEASSSNLKKGKLVFNAENIYFQPDQGSGVPVKNETALLLDQPLNFQAALIEKGLKTAHKLQDIRLKVAGNIQKARLSGEIPWENLEISKAEVKRDFGSHPEVSPPWVHGEPGSHGVEWNLPKNEQGEWGILIAKNFQDSGVRIGDRGYLSYSAPTVSSLVEQRLPVFVAGFYDPGIMSIGNKCILVNEQVTRVINASSSFYNIDKNLSNGIQVWFANLQDAEKIKAEIQKAFKDAGIDSYWNVSTFREYDFAKDLLQQFESDKYLFTLIGAIILAVSVCNIISFLVLLVSDKKKEIGILQSMGASKKSIAAIFAICGGFVGVVSSLIGILLALLTLHNIDLVVKALSFLQGHDAFNALFFGKSLPDQLSSRALYFILIATPLLSILAGLIPAIKACRLKPSAILRSE